MLIYHPAYDVNHGAFRLLAILSCAGRAVDISAIRIVDFYSLFPSELVNVTLTRGSQRLKRRAASLNGKYGKVQNPKQIFGQLEAYQVGALGLLAAYGFIEIRALRESRLVQRTGLVPANAIGGALEGALNRDGEFLRTLARELLGLSLNGKDGLKKRSGLMEYRYDSSEA